MGIFMVGSWDEVLQIIGGAYETYYGSMDSTNDSNGGDEPDVSASGDMDEENAGGHQQCMEDTLMELRYKARDMTMDDNPLCFKIATLFDGWLSERSDSICMYRCYWDEGCNDYLNFNDDDMMDWEYDSCVGLDVELYEGCYDMGFCSDTSEAKDWKFWMWPEHDIEAGEEPMPIYYWMPQIDTDPWGCQLTYEVNKQKNVEWEWDAEWCSEEEIDMGTCPSLILYPKHIDEGSSTEIYIKVKVYVEGTNSYKYYYQYFEWDWEYFNMWNEDMDYYMYDDEMWCEEGDYYCEDDMMCDPDDYYCDMQWDYYDYPEPTFEEMSVILIDMGYTISQEQWDTLMTVEDPDMATADE